MFSMLPRSSVERILVEALAGLGTLRGLEIQTRDEFEVHTEIVKPEMWKSLPHLPSPRILVGVDHVPYVVVYSSLSTK